MTQLLSFTSTDLVQAQARHTAQEIAQQPRLWRQAAAHIAAQRQEIDRWLQPLLARSDLRIILTGAGTSAYIGEALAATLARAMPLATQSVEAIATTDLVSHPSLHLNPARPTLLISYARSGNSPESIAAVECADALLDEVWHLYITCNPDGQLARRASGDKPQHSRSLCLLMPKGSDDQSFAMTSSFTCMLISTLAIFLPDADAVEHAAAAAENILGEQLLSVRQLAESDCTRMVFLGAGALQAIAREAALKVLELTAGQIASFHETPLGFRHGPKSLVDAHTQIILLCSRDHHAHRYDADLLTELRNDQQAQSVTTITLTDASDLTDVWAALPYIVYCQLLAFFKSVRLGISPDNPCPSGLVNRVVRGVIIHPLPERASS